MDSEDSFREHLGGGNENSGFIGDHAILVASTYQINICFLILRAAYIF